MPFMNRKKSWIFIILFALSVNVMHGFFIHHHEHIHKSVHQDIRDEHQITHDICDKCKCIHLSYIVDTAKPELVYIEPIKPIFFDKKLSLSVTIPLLLRPPIV